MFTVKSLHEVLEEKYLLNGILKTRWCTGVPRRINIFTWRASRERLATKSNLLHRGMSGISPLCPLCSTHDETEEHLFLRCSTAKKLMARLINWWKVMPNLDDISSIDDLLNPQGHRGRDALNYEVTIRAFLWTIWLVRNEICFKGKVKCINQMYSDVRALSVFWLKHRGK